MKIIFNPGALIYDKRPTKKFIKNNLKLTPKIIVGLVKPTNNGSVDTLPVFDIF